MEGWPGNRKEYHCSYKLPNGHDTSRPDDRKGVCANSGANLVAESASCHRQDSTNYRCAGAGAAGVGRTRYWLRFHTDSFRGRAAVEKCALWAFYTMSVWMLKCVTFVRW